MASTTFTDYNTIISAAWLNDVDALVWDVFNGATTAGAALTALGVSSYIQGLLDDANEATLKASINLEIGTDVQAYDADLTAIAALAHTKGNVLMSDGSAWTSAPVYGRKNLIINGDFRIDQRNNGAAITSSGFFADRFRWLKSGSATVSATRWTGTALASQGFQYAAYQLTTTGAALAAGDQYRFTHPIEGYNCLQLAFGTSGAKTVTLSFWVNATTAGTYAIGFLNAAANRSYVTTYTVNSASTWEYKTITITGDTTGTWAIDNSSGMQIVWSLGVGSTLTTSNTNQWLAGTYFNATGAVNASTITGHQFYITGIQLEQGSIATSFEMRSIGEELALCQRYYSKSYNLTTVPGTATSTGTEYYDIKATNANSYEILGTMQFPVRMRTNPTVTLYSYVTGSTGYVRDDTSTSDKAALSDIIGESRARILLNNQSVTAADDIAWHWTADAEL